MQLSEAVAFLEPAVPDGTARWADLGAGDGTFTAALAAIIGPGGEVVAVDHDDDSIRALQRLARTGAPSRARVLVARGDLRDPGAIGAVCKEPLDGALFANSLHFVDDPAAVLRRMRAHLHERGTIIVVEYDRTTSNRWVPFPLPPPALQRAADAAGLPSPAIVARRPSTYHGSMYCAVVEVRGIVERRPGSL